MALLNRRKAGQGRSKGSEKPAEPLNFDQIDYFASRESGRLNFDLISLGEIELDPTNPRTEGVDPAALLKVIPKFLIIDPKHEQYDASKVKAFDQAMADAVLALIEQAGKHQAAFKTLFSNLLPLRDNIRLIGVKQPIEVRNTGRRSRYRIVYGHRRFLASILAGERNIPARIVAEDAPNKHVQASENLHQEALSLAHRLRVIEQLLDELGIDAKTPATRVCALTGYAKSQMALYLRVLKGASVKLRQVIDNGELTSLDDAARIAKLPQTEQAAELEKTTATETPPSPPKRKGSGRGRPKTFITTPRIRSPRVIQSLITRLDLPADKTDIDWEDIEAVETLWIETINQLIETLE